MTRYLISFDDGSMDHLTAAELPAASVASRAVVAEAKAAGVWIWGCGIARQQATIVATDGTATPGPTPENKPVIGGLAIIEVESLDDALGWAAKIADACQCAQEVREILYDPES